MSQSYPPEVLAAAGAEQFPHRAQALSAASLRDGMTTFFATIYAAFGIGCFATALIQRWVLGTLARWDYSRKVNQFLAY